MTFDGIPHQRPVAVVKTPLHQHDQVEAAQSLLALAETLPDQALDGVACRRRGQPLGRNGKAEPRPVQTIAPSQHGKYRIARAVAGIEDSLEISGRPQSVFWREAPGLGGHNNFRASGAFYPSRGAP